MTSRRLTSGLGLLVLSAQAVSAKGGHDEGPTVADLLNDELLKWLGWVWVCVVFVFVVYQIVFHFVRYIRTVACLNNEHQRYFTLPNVAHGRFKKYFLDAALFRTRHHREFRLSSAINVGTLPSRLQTLGLVGYVAINVAFSCMKIDYTGVEKTVLSEFRNRTGVLAVVNMIPLFLLAGRNNPFITFCGISFDSFNLLHRWIGRIAVLEAVAHTVAWIISKVRSSGWAEVQKSLTTKEFNISGLVGTVAFVAIFLFAPSIVRHAFYETFLHVHQALAVVALGAVWIHLKEKSKLVLLYGVVGVWAFERGARLASILYRNAGRGGTRADFELLPGDAVRVNLRVARPWTFRPGQHVYLYVPSVGWWTSHPFSLAWSAAEDSTDADAEKGLAVVAADPLAKQRTSVSLIIRRRTGFTDALFRKIEAQPSGKLAAGALVEGPYGGESLSSYGTVLLFAAGIGITHQVPHVREVVAAHANGTGATRRLTLVWIIQSPEHLEWIRPWMTSILSMPRRRDVLKILLFVTRPRSTKEIHSPSASVQMYPGKPNVDALVQQEMAEGVGAACVSVCGTGSLADDVRRAVRTREDKWNVDFREEAFSW